MTHKKAVLLINLGTPDNCDYASVRRYLREFLNDPRVVDLPTVVRWPLVNLAIIPFRYKKSAQAYQQIWQEGSPLLTYTKKVTQLLGDALGQDYVVEMGMRYGNPSIDDALARIGNARSLTVVPLFPQYSSAATGSALKVVLRTVSKKWNIPDLVVKQDFYADPGFIASYVERIQEALKNQAVDLVLFSYHGLPERHLNKSECQAACDHIHACPKITHDNHYCYRAQCYATTELIAKALNLSPDQFAVSFQSRLGRTPWIKPYTDILLPDLIKQGIKNIAIVSPSFVADCLETLEEIDIRTRKQWHDLGGKHFVFVPCLNDSPTWVNALVEMVKKA